jgi:hypothetical protein
MTALYSTPLQGMFVNHPDTSLYIENASEIDGHILHTWSMDQRKEKIRINMCLRTLGFFIGTTLDINTHANNSQFNNGSPITIGLILPLSVSHSTRANFSRQVLEVSA